MAQNFLQKPNPSDRPPNLSGLNCTPAGQMFLEAPLSFLHNLCWRAWSCLSSAKNSYMAFWLWHHIQNRFQSSWSCIFGSSHHGFISSLPSSSLLSFPNCSGYPCLCSSLNTRYTSPPLDLCMGYFFFLEHSSTKYPNGHCLTSFESLIRCLLSEIFPGHSI